MGLAPQKVDAIIVGQGLAGSVLARRLEQEGWKVKIIDQYNKNSASHVAAGMWNPIIFKRLTKIWQGATALPIAEAFFKSWQQELGLEVWHPTPIVKVFHDQQSATDFALRAESDEFSPWLKTNACEDGDSLNAPFGYGRVEGSGYIELSRLLDEARTKWKESGVLIEQEFRESELELSPDSLTYKGIQAKAIILCQGHHMLDGELFGWLPLRRTKGEVLDVEVPGLNRRHIMNNGRWAVPLGQSRFRLGATFDWHTSDTSPTEAGRELLLERLKPVLPGEIKVLDQRGGIRPASSDRRPMLGTHPVHSRVHVFNGLGSRGVMIAPWLSELMFSLLNDGHQLPLEVDISRFS